MTIKLMKNTKHNTTTIDEYISLHPEEIQRILRRLRAAIRAAAPDAEERISYRMPAFWQNGNLVYFAAFQNHIGFFPTSSGIDHFKGELADYKTSRGTVQFPLDRPLPYELIKKIVKFRVDENKMRRPG